MANDPTHTPPPKGEGLSKGSTFNQHLADRGWISLKDFAILAEVSYPTALRWCKLEQVIYKQVGGQKRIYADEIRHFLANGTRPPNQLKWEAMKEHQRAMQGRRE